MKIYLCLAFAALVSACATVQNETRVGAGFNAREFNSITSRYEPRPTFARVQSMTGGSEILRLEMDQYGSTTLKYGVDINHSIPFRLAETDEYIATIHRYLEWEALASERGDMLDRREVGRAAAFNNGDIRFAIYSGNEAAHFLVLTYCAVGVCLDESALYLDRAGAQALIALLERWRAGELAGADLDAIYN